MYELVPLEDMDTSDDVHLNLENDNDAEWVYPGEKKKHQSKKGNSKTDNHVDKVVDVDQSTSVMSTEGICCSCSKSSLCKTSRCECRAASGICSSSCSCGPSKCSNREEASVKDILQLSVNMSTSEEAESSHDLASHGAMLLQTALSEKHANQSTNGTVRKPLSDIGNNIVSLIHGRQYKFNILTIA